MNGTARPIPFTHAQLVDEFARLDIELTGLKSKFKRREDLRLLILSWHSDLPSDKSAVEHGKDFDVTVTLPDNQRLITMPGKRRLFRLWGSTKFIERCTLALKLLVEHGIELSEEKGEILAGRNGPRHLEVLPRVKQAA
jgi:hypothetical protein